MCPMWQLMHPCEAGTGFSPLPHKPLGRFTLRSSLSLPPSEGCQVPVQASRVARQRSRARAAFSPLAFPAPRLQCSRKGVQSPPAASNMLPRQ